MDEANRRPPTACGNMTLDLSVVTIFELDGCSAGGEFLTCSHYRS